MRSSYCFLLLFSFSFAVGTISTPEPMWWKIIHYKHRGTSVWNDHYMKNYFERKQLKMIKKQPNVLNVLIMALQNAVTQCQKKFKNQQWNCSTNASERGNLFREITRYGGKETAFLYALISASTVEAVAQSCNAGHLTHCSCGSMGPGPIDNEHPDWHWSGCAPSLRYAKGFARRFLDVEKGNDLRGYMNSHNTEAGRAHVKTSDKKCFCSGLSGSCTMRSCMLPVESIEKVTWRLSRRFSRATRLQSVNDGRNILRQKRASISDRRNLVYLEETPDLCKITNNTANKGRICYNTTTCDGVCCQGSGSATQRVEKHQNCLLEASGEVTCQTVVEEILVFYCR